MLLSHLFIEAHMSRWKAETGDLFDSFERFFLVQDFPKKLGLRKKVH